MPLAAGTHSMCDLRAQFDNQIHNKFVSNFVEERKLEYSETIPQSQFQFSLFEL